jgi:hypothetical protein
MTGNTSLAQYVFPPTFILLNVIYGGALLLIRETVARRHKGFATVLVLAAGYGMVNEAICTKGLFDPKFYAVVADGLEGFGRYFGINVAWAVSISIIHAVYSIIVPYLIVSMIFPGSNPWIGKRAYLGLCIVLVAVCIFAFQFIALPPDHYHYSEGPGPLLLILALMTSLVIIGLRMRPVQVPKWDVHLHPGVLFILGAAFIFAFWFLPGVVRTISTSPIAFIAFHLACFVVLPLWLVIKLPDPSAWGKIALLAGLLSLFMASSFLAGVTGSPGRLFPFGYVLALLVIALTRTKQTAAPLFGDSGNLAT